MFEQIEKIAAQIAPTELAMLCFVGVRAMADAGLVSPGALAEIKNAAGQPLINAIAVDPDGCNEAQTVRTYYSVNVRSWELSGLRTKWFKNLADARKCAADPYADVIVVHNINDPEEIMDIEEIIAAQQSSIGW